MTQDFIVTVRNLRQFSFVEPEDHVEHYLPYTDCGFNVLYSGYNYFGQTKLAQKAQRDRNKLIKFRTIGAPSVVGMIDFKFVIPTRMFERYAISSEASAAGFTGLHYGESAAQLSASRIIFEKEVYDPVQYSLKIKTTDLTLNVDEEYFNFLSSYGYEDSLTDELVEYPYLWAYEKNGSMQDIPDEYVYSFKKDGALSGKDNIIIRMSEDVNSAYTDISMSFGENPYTKKTQLDFNSVFFFGREKSDDDYEKNIFNRKHLFLNLDEPGTAGWLFTYESAESFDPAAKYYIKNISDPDPKKGDIRFILSAFFRDDRSTSGQYLFVTEPNTVSVDSAEPLPEGTNFEIVYNNAPYTLAIEDE